MRNWIPHPPSVSTMGDHDVPVLGHNLDGKRIALLVCGGIAAMRTPMLARALRRFGATVIAYVSPEAPRYVALDSLEWATHNKVITQLSPNSEHLSNQQPFDAFLVAPATYNTINKFNMGIADGLITTTLASALGRLERGNAKVLVAPTMHGDMYNSVLEQALLTLQAKGVMLIPPRDDYGKLNIPENDVITAYVCAEMSRSPLKGQRILVTAGATPTPIDNVRAITNRFRGRLGIEIAAELVRRGADVRLILGAGAVDAPSFLETLHAPDFDAYKHLVLTQLETFSPQIGIFCAAVADYAPKQRFAGKVPSNGFLQNIELQPTEKIIDLARAQAPAMRMVSFKYQENIEHSELMRIAEDRLKKGHEAVVANRGEETGPHGEQIAYLVAPGSEPLKLLSKPGIARGLSDWLEKRCEAQVQRL